MLDIESLGLEDIESLRLEIEEREARNRKKVLEAAHARQGAYDALAPAHEKAHQRREEALQRLLELTRKVQQLEGALPGATLSEDEETIGALKAEYTATAREMKKANAAFQKAGRALEAASYDELEEAKALEEDLKPLVSEAGGGFGLSLSEWPPEALEISNRLLDKATKRRAKLEADKRQAAWNTQHGKANS